MISSSRVVKAGQQSLGRQRLAVDVAMPEVEETFEPAMSEAVGEVLTRAKGEARAIIEEAEAAAVAVRDQARAEGYQAGYERGRDDGRQAVAAEWDALRPQLEEPLALIARTRQYLDLLHEESTLAVAAALSLAVYSRLKLERLDVVTAYIEELVSTVDGSKVSLFLDATWGPRLKALEELLHEALPSLTLAVDESLAHGIMRAEGENGGVLGGPWLSLKALLEEVLG